MNTMNSMVNKTLALVLGVGLLSAGAGAAGYAAFSSHTAKAPSVQPQNVSEVSLGETSGYDPSGMIRRDLFLFWISRFSQKSI